MHDKAAAAAAHASRTVRSTPDPRVSILSLSAPPALGAATFADDEAAGETPLALLHEDASKAAMAAAIMAAASEDEGDDDDGRRTSMVSQSPPSF